MNTRTSIFVLAASVSFVATSVFADSTENTSHVVDFKMTASQPSIRDTSLNDTFRVNISAEKFAKTSFEVECSAGSSGHWMTFGLARTDETCRVSGKGAVINPNNGKEFQRMQYSGGFKILADKDGYVDARTINASYLKLGTSSAESDTFSGSAMMQPENPSASASQLLDQVKAYAKANATGTDAIEISSEMDSIRLDNFLVPNVGGRGTMDCSWTGDMIYAYVSEAWQMDLTVNCGGTIYQLEGNMPWVDIEDQPHNAEYVVNLMTSGTEGSDPFAAADPFAEVNGVVGTIKMTQSGFTEVKIGDETDDVATSIDAEGNFSGNGVPIDLTYSFANLMAVFARTFFGA